MKLLWLAALLATSCGEVAQHVPPREEGLPSFTAASVLAVNCDEALDDRALGAPEAPQPTAGSLALVLNVPAFRLDVLEGGRRIREIQVAVGTPDHPTPIGDFQITRVIWNPWWIPPPFEWAQDESVTPPGPDNPTGRVKLQFGRYLFLHGTPLEESLGQAASHGCVRMTNADAMALARLVHALSPPEVGAALLDSLEAETRRTQAIVLDAPVSLAIRYDLVELRDGRIEIHRDIYTKQHAVTADDVVAVLLRAGHDPSSIDRASLESALREPRDARLSIPVAQLLRSGAGRPDERTDTGIDGARR